MAGGAGSFSDSGRADRRSGIVGGENTVFAVTIRADRRIGLALSSELTVDTFPIVMFNALMAAAAGFGDDEMIYR